LQTPVESATLERHETCLLADTDRAFDLVDYTFRLRVDQRIDPCPQRRNFRSRIKYRNLRSARTGLMIEAATAALRFTR